MARNGTSFHPFSVTSTCHLDTSTYGCLIAMPHYQSRQIAAADLFSIVQVREEKSRFGKHPVPVVFIVLVVSYNYEVFPRC